ncbi:hypothetical protein HY745_12260 [Candidatus Desantisbacteria bacterium]|nr:hypothetical protein [Candidatus Desantisbacteria bacterium]
MKVGITGAGGNVGTTLRKGLSSKYELILYDINNIKQAGGNNFFKVDFADKNVDRDIFKGLEQFGKLFLNFRD